MKRRDLREKVLNQCGPACLAALDSSLSELDALRELREDVEAALSVHDATQQDHESELTAEETVEAIRVAVLAEQEKEQ